LFLSKHYNIFVGVPLSVTAVAQVRVIKEEQKSLDLAVEQFGGKTSEEIGTILLETFEGHLRGILGTMNVEEVFQDRTLFATEVREVAATDVSKMGIRILSFVIKEIKGLPHFILCYYMSPYNTVHIYTEMSAYKRKPTNEKVPFSYKPANVLL